MKARSVSNFMHEIPRDMKSILKTKKDIASLWECLTPLSQNEWICWVTIVKKEETRQKHLKRFEEDILKGKKRPCCWPGCPHRRKSATKWFK